MLNPEFNRLIGQRSLNGEKLADLAGCGRAHLMQVLGGTRAGKYTWKRLGRVLTKEEYDLAWNFACERRIVAAGWEGEIGAEQWCFRDRERSVVEKPGHWPEVVDEEFLRGKKIEIPAIPIAQK